jgi:hypothetical protein
MWGMSLSVPIATGVAILRGQLTGESLRISECRSEWVSSSGSLVGYWSSRPSRCLSTCASAQGVARGMGGLLMGDDHRAGPPSNRRRRRHRRSAPYEATWSNTESLGIRGFLMPS